MAATSDNSSKPRRVIDVTQPGQSEPSASARPIIVSNRPVLQKDPMVVSDGPVERDVEDTPAGDVPKANVNRTVNQEGVTIMPPTAPGLPKSAKKAEAESTDAQTEPVDKTAKPVAEAPEPKAPETNEETPEAMVSEAPAEEAKEDKSKTAATEKEPVSKADDDEEKSANSAEDEQLSPNKVLDEAAKKLEEEKAAKAAEHEKIIESKKYFLPINSVERRRNTRRAILFLVLCILFALIWLDLALDAGILKIGSLHPLTHFFNSNS
jgi:hypothetical protein